MVLSLFDQFASPVLLGIPLIALALTIPWIFFPTPTSNWAMNRTQTAHSWFLIQLVYQIFSAISPGGRKWAALLTALMLFLMTLNMLGLLPYTFTPTSQLSMSLGFAVPLWLATVIMGFTKDPSAALAHLLPSGTPTPLIPILIAIETVSLLIRPIALGVRLTANVTAGHLLIQLISLATFYLATTMPPVAILTSALLLMLTLLEVAVALIQAYVFALLLSLYLEENVK